MPNHKDALLRTLRGSLGAFAPVEAKILKRRISAPRRQRFAEVLNSMQVVSKPATFRGQAGAIWAVTMVRNEVDILDATLRHLLAQEIDAIVIADNGSSDGTHEVIAEHCRSFPILWLNCSLQKRYQAEVISHMAQRARSHGARWIVPFDADEFWFAQDTTLGTELRTSPGRIRTARIFNAFPRIETSGYGFHGFRLDVTPHHHKKIATRASPFLYIKQGNHDVERRGDRHPGLTVLHYPWRSFDQLREKARRGAQAYADTGLPEDFGFHLRYLGSLSMEELERVWQDIVSGVHVPGIDWSPVGPCIENFDVEKATCWAQLVRTSYP